MEVYRGQIDLKSPAQLPVFAFIDSKSLWESLYSSKQCEEKLLCNSIAGMKELIQLRMVNDVSWVPTDKQLADCMTKRGKNASTLLQLADNRRL